MMDSQMSKRFQVTLPDIMYKRLEEWANKEGRPVANLAAFIIESRIRQCDGDSEISLPDSGKLER